MNPQLLNNRYRIIRALGTGGFGDTFLAEDTQMPSVRRCVIKQLKPITHNSQIYELVQERFQREAAILEQLGDGSDQIPRLYAYFITAGQFYLVQEWIEGETLTQTVQQQGVLSENSVRDIVASLLPVLDYIHDHRIVHRDIKPDNIILRRRDGKPVLIDFGAVKETMGTVVNSQGNTTGTIVIGTPGFMPSEQAAGRPLYSSDLYSLGLTAIYLLTGKQPQELEIDPSTGDILWHQHALSVSPSLAGVLDKAIQSHPRDRYPTARAMLDAIQVGAAPFPATLPIPQQLIVSPHPPTESSVRTLPLTTMPPRQGIKSNAVIIGGLIASGLLGASIIIFLALKQSPQPLTQTANISSPVNSPSVEPSIASTSSSSPAVSPQPVATVPSIPPTPTPNTPVPPSPITQIDDYSWLSKRFVTNADLSGRSAFELDIIRNSIYARYGRRFQNAELQRYFNNQSWYRPFYSPDEFPNSLLSKLEKQNAADILQYQDRYGLRWAK